jgi:SAM-dependent methyltransferase
MADSMGIDSNPMMVHRCCPLCGADRPEPYLTAHDVVFRFAGVFHIVRCAVCGMFYTNPQVTPQKLLQFYPHIYTAHQSREKNPKKLREKDVWDHVPMLGGGHMLDVGCGNGDYLYRQQKRGWRVLGIEPSSQGAEATRRRGIEVIEGAWPDVALGERRFELITLLGVLDHLPDPLGALRWIRGLLRDGGMAIVSVPNAASAATSLFGAHWPGWDLPRHQNHFTRPTLKEMLLRAGFQQVEILGRRRPARWRQSARIMLDEQPRFRWKCLARSRRLCSLVSSLLGTRGRQDEIVAVAGAHALVPDA